MKILFVFAHPDDESFSSGGTIIKLVRAGHTVKLITATKGEAGLPGTPPITTMNKLPKVREQELRNATKVLGIKQIYFLGLIDGTLHKLKQEKLIRVILPILEKENPDIVITFDKNGGSNHPDHIAVSKATTEAFGLFEKNSKKNIKLYHTAIPRSNIEKLKKTGISYNAFGEAKGVNDEFITTKVNIKKYFKQKVTALKMHKTQNKDWERFLKREFVIDLNHEYFRLISESELV